jgi:hypothetical protein
VRIKIAILTVIAVSFILLTSCMLPPDIGVYMYMNGIIVPYNNATGYVTVSVDVENVGYEDLTNVKGLFDILHSSGEDNYWSEGISSLDVGEVLTDYALDIYIPEEPNSVTSIELVGFGCDNPPDN